MRILNTNWFVFSLRWRLRHACRMARYLIQCIYLPAYKTDMYSKDEVYDGMTRNDFMYGNLITILIKLDIARSERDGYWDVDV